MAVFLIFGPFMGAFVNRFGCHITITVGCLVCATGLVLGSLAPNIVILYLAFSVPFGIGMSSLYISSPVAVSQYFSKKIERIEPIKAQIKSTLGCKAKTRALKGIFLVRK